MSNLIAAGQQTPPEKALHIPPFEVAQDIVTDTDQSATYDFLLVIYSSLGPNSYCLRDKRQIRLKIAKFSHPRSVFNTAAVAHCVIAVGLEKLE